MCVFSKPPVPIQPLVLPPPPLSSLSLGLLFPRIIEVSYRNVEVGSAFTELSQVSRVFAEG